MLSKPYHVRNLKEWDNGGYFNVLSIIKTKLPPMKIKIINGKDKYCADQNTDISCN